MFWFSKLKIPSAPLTKYPAIPIRLHNTLGNAEMVFVQPTGKEVRMYNCGPTVYGPAHIGNLRSYIFADVLRRTLEYNSLSVKQVINITDVGHLTSDADAGEDKMSKGLKREKMKFTLENMHTLAERYAELFIENLRSLSINTDSITFPRASEYIDAMVAMIQTLEQKGYTYQTSDGVYFDIARFPMYGALGNIDLEAQKEGARVEANPEKHNPADFNLWKKDEKLGWKSPWGQGFPGWHIECSAMARSLLGEQIDIHTGGIDHVSVHHNNEIAQSESATGKKPFSRVWMHNEFITIDNAKISKSLENDITLAELPKKDIHPLALRYFYLGARYSTPLNFSWESLQAAQSALLRLHFIYDSLDEAGEAELAEGYRTRFHECINNDLDTAGALGVMWEMLKDKGVTPASMRATLKDLDSVLGLQLGNASENLRTLIRAQFGEVVANGDLPENIRTAIAERESAREAKDWDKADTLRDQIVKASYTIEDTPGGAKILKK